MKKLRDRISYLSCHYVISLQVRDRPTNAHAKGSKVSFMSRVEPIGSGIVAVVASRGWASPAASRWASSGAAASAPKAGNYWKQVNAPVPRRRGARPIRGRRSGNGMCIPSSRPRPPGARGIARSKISLTHMGADCNSGFLPAVTAATPSFRSIFSLSVLVERGDTLTLARGLTLTLVTLSHRRATTTSPLRSISHPPQFPSFSSRKKKTHRVYSPSSRWFLSPFFPFSLNDRQALPPVILPTTRLPRNPPSDQVEKPFWCAKGGIWCELVVGVFPNILQKRKQVLLQFLAIIWNILLSAILLREDF